MTQQEEQEIKAQLYEQFAQIGKALGSARRLDLIDLLAQSEYTVEKLAQETGMSVANTSQHLKTLRAARLVEVRREGVVAYHRLADEVVLRTWQMIRQLGEECIVEINWLARRLSPDRDRQAMMRFDDLLPLLGGDAATVIDVRPALEYRAGHIPGAHSIPLSDLPARLPELSKEQQVVVYCRGPYSMLADQATSLLRSHGYSAKRLEQGLPEWRSQGYPIGTAPKEMQPSP